MLIAACANSAEAADISAEIVLVSDYRYRGLSLSDKRPAIQLSITAEHDSGFYANLWGSTIKDPGEAISSEVDLAVGYAFDLSQSVSLDVSGIYFVYPGDSASNYFEATAAATVTRNAVSASLGMSFVPDQKATRDDHGRKHSNAYVFATAEYDVADTPAKLKTGLGYEHGWFDETAGGGKWDWSLGGELELAPARLGLTYVGYGGRHQAGHGIVASLAIGL